MPRIMQHVKGGVEIWIRTRDEHPPPHVHVEHHAQGWEIKVEFSYIENQPSTYLIHPIGGKLPTQSKLNALALEIMKARRECRDSWWLHVPDAGLANKRVLINNGWASPAKSGALGSILVATAEYLAPIETMKFNGNILGLCP